MRPSNQMIANTNSSGSFSSAVVYAWDIVRASFQANVTAGSINGTFQVQGSNQNASGASPQTFIPTQWNNISSATVVASSSATQSSFLILPIECSYNYLRVNYTPAVAALVGSVTIMISAKAL